MVVQEEGLGYKSTEAAEAQVKGTGVQETQARYPDRAQPLRASVCSAVTWGTYLQALRATETWVCSQRLRGPELDHGQGHHSGSSLSPPASHPTYSQWAAASRPGGR
jgi:hypothetical protein